VLERLASGGLTADEVEPLVSAVAGELDRDDQAPFWRLVDHVARLRGLGESELELVTAILEVVAGHAASGRRPRT